MIGRDRHVRGGGNLVHSSVEGSCDAQITSNKIVHFSRLRIRSCFEPPKNPNEATRSCDPSQSTVAVCCAVLWLALNCDISYCRRRLMLASVGDRLAPGRRALCLCSVAHTLAFTIDVHSHRRRRLNQSTTPNQRGPPPLFFTAAGPSAAPPCPACPLHPAGLSARHMPGWCADSPTHVARWG